MARQGTEKFMISNFYAEVKAYNHAGVMIQHTCPIGPTALQADIDKWKKRMAQGLDVAKVEITRGGFIEIIRPEDVEKDDAK